MTIFGTRMQCIERSIQVAGEVELEASTDLSQRLALSCSSVRVAMSCRNMSHSHDDHAGWAIFLINPPVWTGSVSTASFDAGQSGPQAPTRG